MFHKKSIRMIEKTGVFYPYALERTWYHSRFWFGIVSVLPLGYSLHLLRVLHYVGSAPFHLFTSFWPFCTWVSMSIIRSSDSSVKTQSTTCIQFPCVFYSCVHMWNSNSRIVPRIETADSQEIYEILGRTAIVFFPSSSHIYHASNT